VSVAQSVQPIEYPESDGKPMGETDVHIDWMIRLRDILRYRYRGQQVYVASNLLLYYEEGDPTRFVVPDDFVVKDCDPGPRRTFKIWEEGKAPAVVFEVTSRSSRREDQVFKPKVYARLAVPEYFLYDPTAEYLHPPLQGFRLVGESYQPITPDETGAIESEQLEIKLRLESGDLVMYDVRTSKVLPTAAEAAEAGRTKEKAARNKEKAAREAAEASRNKEQSAREAAEARAAALEEELKQLRDELQRNKRKNPDS
jgi:hypothetical protein